MRENLKTQNLNPQQHLSLAKLTEERFELRDSAAQLSEKYEDLRDNEGNLVARIEAVLNAIQRSSSSHVFTIPESTNLQKHFTKFSFFCFFIQGRSF